MTDGGQRGGHGRGRRRLYPESRPALGGHTQGMTRESHGFPGFSKRREEELEKEGILLVGGVVGSGFDLCRPIESANGGDLLAGLSGAGNGSTVLDTSNGSNVWQAAMTNNTPSISLAQVPALPGPEAGNYWEVMFPVAKAIESFHITSDPWGNNGPTDIAVQSSDDGVSWTTRWQWSVDGPEPTLKTDGSGWSLPLGVGTNYYDWGILDLPGGVVTAKWWRFTSMANSGGGNPWHVGVLALYEGNVRGSGDGHPDLVGTSIRATRCDHRHDVHRTVAPTATDDETLGYKVGTIWAQLDDLSNPTEITAVWMAAGVATNAADWLPWPLPAVTASDVTYDNAASGMVATDVQAGIDELEARVDTLEADPGASALDDLSDVVITSPASGHRLRYNGTTWVNSSLKWVPLTVYDGTNYLPLVDGDGNQIMAEA